MSKIGNKEAQRRALRERSVATQKPRKRPVGWVATPSAIVAAPPPAEIPPDEIAAVLTDPVLSEKAARAFLVNRAGSRKRMARKRSKETT